MERKHTHVKNVKSVFRKEMMLGKVLKYTLEKRSLLVISVKKIEPTYVITTIKKYKRWIFKKLYCRIKMKINIDVIKHHTS